MAPASGRATIHIDAPPERVYDLISDVTRMDRWSPENRGGVWLDGATGPAVDVRFRGSNRKGIVRWSTKPIIEVAEPGRELTFATQMRKGGAKYTRWSYKLTPADGGTAVEESWEIVTNVPVVGRILLSAKRAAELVESMEETLRRLKEAAEA
jgi:uncharacterized protein YndB with AHSA1/START domain